MLFRISTLGARAIKKLAQDVSRRPYLHAFSGRIQSSVPPPQVHQYFCTTTKDSTLIHLGWYTRSKHVFDSLRNVGSKLASKSPTQSPGLRVPSNSSSFYNPCKSCGIFGSPSISSKFGYLNGLKQNRSSLISGVTRRSYYVDRNQVHHFKPRGYRRWFENPRNVLIVVVVGSGAAISIYFGNMEVVPYTKRKHFVLVSKNLETRLGESQFKEMKKSFKGKILPAIHPDSVRVRLIAKDIIDALQRGLRNEQVWSDPHYSSEGDMMFGNSTDETLKALTEGAEEKVAEDWRKEEEVLDDKWIKESRRQGEKQGAKPSTHHLEGLNWEVLVVDEPVVNAFCLPGGKIVVCSGLLKHLQTDAEIATIIGHEVGLAVARHFAKHNSKNLGLVITRLVLYGVLKPDVVDQMSNLLLTLPISRKMEREADYIGLLLMASAGYDPRVALNVYEKLGKLGGGDLVLGDYLSAYPSGMKRAQLLARAQVMEEALSIYRQSASRGAASQLINS